MLGNKKAPYGGESVYTQLGDTLGEARIVSATINCVCYSTTAHWEHENYTTMYTIPATKRIQINTAPTWQHTESILSSRRHLQDLVPLDVPRGALRYGC